VCGARHRHQLALRGGHARPADVGEFKRSVPFAVKRCFMVLDVPSAEVRGDMRIAVAIDS
jgi:hypothetical protein